MSQITIPAILGATLPLILPAVLEAQPLNERVLVVYDANNADSVAVASHYRTRRNIPSAHLCAIAPASMTLLTEGQYETSVKEPVRACLKAAGRRRILYIVLSWGTPYKLNVNSRNFALDSALADVWDEAADEFALHPDPPESGNPYYADVQTLGNVYPPFVPLSKYRANAATKTVYSVWRLDAATPALAKGLVDKAMQAESAGLAGIGCFDRNRGNIELQGDASYIAGDWDLARAAQFARQAGFNVMEDANSAEFGTVPAPPRCDGAALYAGWYSYNNYPGAFTWNTGAIGFHLDSGSALNPRAGSNFTARAIQDGITITGGAVNEPYLSGVVHPDVFFRSLFEGANVGDAMLRSLPWLKWMVLSAGDPLYCPFPGGRAPFNSPRKEDALSISPRSVLGGASVTGTVYLSAPARSGGAVVNLTSAVPRFAAVPATVTVPAGLRTASFPITTVRPIEDYVVRIEAAYNGVVRRNSVSVVPILGSIAQLQSSSVIGGGARLFRMNLNGPAPAGGLTVSLTSNNAAAEPPARLTIAAGERAALFSVATNPVSANTSVTISATDDRTTRGIAFKVVAPYAASVTLSPTSVKGPGRATGTIALTGAAPVGGTTVMLSTNSQLARVPASIVVPAGATTATFSLYIGTVTSNTQIRITALAGNISRTATLTVTAGVTPNLSAVRVMGRAKPTLTLTSGAPAPAGGATFSLSPSHPRSVTLPASTTIRAGSTVVGVPFVTEAVSSTVCVRVAVKNSAETSTASLSVLPVLVKAIPATIDGGLTVSANL